MFKHYSDGLLTRFWSLRIVEGTHGHRFTRSP